MQRKIVLTNGEKGSMENARGQERAVGILEAFPQSMEETPDKHQTQASINGAKW